MSGYMFYNANWNEGYINLYTQVEGLKIYVSKRDDDERWFAQALEYPSQSYAVHMDTAINEVVLAVEILRNAPK
jgi:hypothetical protein